MYCPNQFKNQAYFVIFGCLAGSAKLIPYDVFLICSNTYDMKPVMRAVLARIIRTKPHQLHELQNNRDHYDYVEIS